MEKKEREVIGTCEGCGAEIYEGDEYFKTLDDKLLCTKCAEQ